MTLTALEVKKLTCPTGQDQCKKSDGNGLYLIIKSSGSKLWRLRYKFAGKHQELALGQYPTIFENTGWYTFNCGGLRRKKRSSRWNS